MLLALDGATSYTSLALVADDASRNYWSADISGVAAGHLYRFHIENDPTRGPCNPGGPFEHVDPYARQVATSDGSSPGYAIDPSFPFQNSPAPAPQDYLIYQMQIGSYCGKNDTITTAFNAAQYTDIIPKLGDIAKMGFTAIQFLPTGEFHGYTDEGYAPTNFFSPESSQGAPAGLRQLVDAAHGVGLAVVFDVIYNHLPDTDDNLWTFDGNYANRGGGIYIADADRTDWGWRIPTDRQPIHDFFMDNMRMWFKEYNADGIRFDSLHNIYPEGGAWWLMQEAAKAFPNKVLIAEHDNPSWALGRYPLEGVWDMNSADKFRDQVLATGSLDNLQSLIGFDGAPHAANYIRYLLGSHDQIFNQYFDKDGWAKTYNRYFVERVGGVLVGRNDWTARAKARLAWGLNVTMCCTPMLFMGSEVHHYGYWDPTIDQYGDHRFDWNLPSDEIGKQMIALVTAANGVRTGHQALRTDTLAFIHRDDQNDVLAFKRWNESGDIVVTVVNIGGNQFNDATYGISMGGENGTWEEIFNSQSPQFGGWADSGNYQTYPSVQGDGKIYIRLPKLGVLVFRKT